MKRAATGFLALLVALAFAKSIPGKDPPKPVPVPGRGINAHCYPIAQFKEVAISPNGKWLAWVEMLPTDKDLPTTSSAIYVVETGDAQPAAANSRRATGLTPMRSTTSPGRPTAGSWCFSPTRIKQVNCKSTSPPHRMGSRES